MSVGLAKGQKLSLTKGDPGRKEIVIALGWDVNAYDTGAAFDLDASAFLLGADGKVSDSRDFVFYGNLEHESGSVMLPEINPAGEGGGDDAHIIVNLGLVPESVLRIAFTASIYDAEIRQQTFGQVSHAYIRIFDSITREEILRYNLADNFTVETAIVFGEIYNNNGEWKFNAMGNGYVGGLAGLCGIYGVEVG